MHFQNRLIEQPQRLFDGSVVDLDQQTAKELVEVVFEAISFLFSNFDCEFHNVALSKTVFVLNVRATSVPIGFTANLEH